jgi:hypothetical protein
LICRTGWWKLEYGDFGLTGNNMKTKGVMLSMLLCAVCTAWAGNDRDAEKIRLVEKIYREQGFMKYASPEFKRIVRKGEKIAYPGRADGVRVVRALSIGLQ